MNVRARTVRYAALLSSTSATTAQASSSNSRMRVARPAGAAVRALFDVGTRFKDVPAPAGSCDVIYDQAVTASSSRFSDPPQGSVSPELSFDRSAQRRRIYRYSYFCSYLISSDQCNTQSLPNAYCRSTDRVSLGAALQ